MAQTPQEGAGNDPRSVVKVTPSQVEIRVDKWTDGTHAVKVQLNTNTARYEFAFSKLEFVAFVLKGMEHIGAMLRDDTKGR